MLTNLESAVTNISEEELQKLFDETPDNMGNAGSSVKTDDTDPKNPIINNPSLMGDVNQINESDLDLLLKGGPSTSGTSGDSSTAGTSGTSGDSVTSGTAGTSGNDNTSGTSGTQATSGTSAQIADADQYNEVLTNTVKFLVEKGLFKDFDGRETMKFNEEDYAKLVEAQIASLVEDRYSEKKKLAGNYGNAILDYIEKGGNADEVIDLFKEQKEIEEFDTTTDESRKELVVKYYKEAHNWKPDKIKKFVDGLLADEGALETEANDIKAKYEAYYKTQLAELQEQQDQIKAESDRRQKLFETSISQTIDKTKDLDDVRKKLIKDSLFKPTKLNNGTVTNSLYVKLSEIQAKPEDYIDFVEFVMDREGYLKRKELEFRNKAVDKKFQFVKGGGALDKNKGSSHADTRGNDDNKKTQGTSFKFAIAQ